MEIDPTNTLRYESRKDLWFSVVVWASVIVCVFTIYLAGKDESSFVFGIVFSVFILAVIAFLLHIYFNTYYLLSKDELKIFSGFMKQIIPLSSITEMKKVTDILSNPALSSRRVLIKHKKSYIGVQISPIDRDDFINQVNKRIELIGKEN